MGCHFERSEKSAVTSKLTHNQTGGCEPADLGGTRGRAEEYRRAPMGGASLRQRGNPIPPRRPARRPRAWAAP